MKIDKLKKALFITSLSTLGISCIMFILAIFKVNIFEGIQFRFLLIFCTLTIACAVSINEINVIKRKKILGIISISFLLLSVLFALIIFCSPIFEKDNFFNRLTGIISIFSILFMIIISLYVKLNKSYIYLQIICYSTIAFVDIILSILIGGFDIFGVTAITEIFWVFVVISVGMLVTLSILSTRKNEKIQTETDTITINRREYEELKRENSELKKELLKLKK